ncbi:MAG: helix-turn-helix domain-containing protein [Caulobacter sp.]|nr:helix-turn-helix domain-containing protein [Caulobacter sp.]
MSATVLAFQSVPQASGAAAPRSASMPFASGGEIYAQGEETTFIYQVLEGSVRTVRLDADGRRQIGDFYHAGDFFGLESGGEHRFAAEALGDCRIALIRRSALTGVDAAEIWEATARELERAREHLMMLLGRKTAREKVAGFLLDLAERQSGAVKTLPMGRQDIADYLGLTIETVSRMLSQLQVEGMIKLIGLRRFSLGDPRALSRLAAA